MIGLERFSLYKNEDELKADLEQTNLVNCPSWNFLIQRDRKGEDGKLTDKFMNEMLFYLLVVFGHCIKGHKAFLLLDFNDKSSEFLFVEIHYTLRQRSQIPFVVASGQKSRPGKNIGSIPEQTVGRQAK